jgi:hypothetical protein
VFRDDLSLRSAPACLAGVEKVSQQQRQVWSDRV